ncbi:MAG TPA: DUF899 family protein [Myxococcota bacterium]|jgi:predicted dithiol-disulfide oxidoreductase (DUF899 family)|nr:DUF899 family protein [Myxococcota bacterium]
MSKSLHDARFPAESPAYRAARDELLRAELELGRHLERVAALRRALPLGGAAKEDYVFDEGAADLADAETVRRVKLSELFGNKDTLLLYSFMYGPKMAKPCPMCTSLLDGLNGQAVHLAQRVSFAVAARSPLPRIRAFARERGWGRLRLLSSAENGYNADYHAENASGGQLPALNVFVRRDGRVHHFYNTEALYAPSDPGQDSRHVDLLWPLWQALDLTPDGRGADFYPKLSYGA